MSPWKGESRFSLMLAVFLWCGMGCSSVWAQGFLIPTKRSLKPLSLKHHRVSVKLRDRVAQTRVEQVFVNSTGQLLEATYIFPLPPGATVSQFVLYINGKATKGQVLERGRAASIYQSIVRRMRDPGLLEYMGGRLFKARVYPIPRKGEQKIAISFAQTVPFQGGLHRYVYPMKTSRQRMRTQRDFTMSLVLQSKTPIKNIYSPTHRVSIGRRGERKAIVGFEKNQALLHRDFVLYYSVSPKDLGINLLTHRVGGGDGYFLMMATPKVAYRSQELSGKNITFVLDTSGSMSGAKMKWAKRALRVCLSKLNPKDHFNVVRFSTDVEALFRDLKPASSGMVKKAQSFVKRMNAVGGTALDEALKVALKQQPKGKGINIVVLITDGHPTIGETSPRAILKNARKRNKGKRVRLFTFGIGSSINIKLLDKLAQGAGGTSDYVKPNREISQRINWFYDKVRYPVLSEIQMKLGGSIRLYDVYPKRIPDLFRGEQILMFGRYRGKGDASISLTGKVGSKARKYVFESRFASKSKEHGFLAKLWAHRKIAYLLDNIRLHGEKAELKAEVIRLAKKFGIVTPYTSYLVLEKGDMWRIHGRRPLVQKRRVRNLRRPGRWRGRLGGNGLAPSPRMAPLYGNQSVTKKRFSPKGSFRASSGRGAVRLSRKLQKMKKARTLSRGSLTRYIQGKLFVWKKRQWVDQAYRSSMKVMRIKYMSPLYFQILKLRPALRRVLSLGARVVVVVAKNRALVIGPQGAKQSTKKLKVFLRR